MEQILPATRSSLPHEMLQTLRTLALPHLETCSDLIDQHRRMNSGAEALRELNVLQEGHRAYLNLSIDPARLCGLQFPTGIDGARAAIAPRPAGVVLSSDAHFHADVVVVRCMDNRCSSPNVELDKPSHAVCEVVSAGHILNPKDLESLAVGIALKEAKVILIEAHGGVCGAIKLALTELGEGAPQHALTAQIARGLSAHDHVDSAEIFAGTLENLNAQLEKVLDPKLNLELLKAHTGEGSFRALFEQGRCMILGVYVDFEVFKDETNSQLSLIKRLTFFDSAKALHDFIEAKIAAYLALRESKS